MFPLKCKIWSGDATSILGLKGVKLLNEQEDYPDFYISGSQLFINGNLLGDDNLLQHHKIASPNVRIVETTQNFKTPVGICLPQILGGNKGTGMYVGKIYDIDPARFSGRQIGHGIFWIPDKNFHPWRGVKDTISFGIPLG